jgi:hypothetical protein
LIQFFSLKGKHEMKTKIFNAISLAVIMAMLVTTLALADNLQGDDLVAGNNASKQPGQTGTAAFFLQATGPDGCNADATNPVTVNVSSSQSWLTINTPGNVSLTGCGSGNTVTIGYSVASNAPVGGVAVVAGTASGGKSGNNGFNNNPGDFNVTVVAPPPPSDSTPPSITPNVSGTLGNNGWYVSDVTVSWTVSDPESTVSSTSGCGSSSVTSDTAGQTFTCSATSAGGTNSQSVTIKRDATAPSISGSAAPAPNGAGWNNSDVSITFVCSDALSGLASCGPNQSLSGDGSNQSASGTAVDNAGNSASATVSGIDLDKTAPTISGSASPVSNANGWNNSDVTVSFICGDGLSGVAACTSPVILSGEGAGQSVTGTVVDNADNSADVTVSNINIDKTSPTASASASPAPNANGWNNGDVTVSFSGSDALSDIDFCDADVVLSSEGAGQSTSGTCTDMAGNVSDSATASGINIDKTAPVVTVTGVANGATYIMGSVPAAGCSTSDVLSGVASAASLGMSGGPLGAITATCSGATDNAGNAAGSVSATYNVIYNWNGFFQPIDNLPILNKAKAGSAIPVKFSLSGFQGLNIFLAGYPVSTVTTCGSTTTDTIETTVTAGSSSLSYDATSDQYNYVWKTDKSWAGTCRTLTVKLIDGTIHQANFNFTK